MTPAQPAAEPVHDDVDAAVEDPAEGVVAAGGPGQHHPTVYGGNEVVEYLDETMLDKFSTAERLTINVLHMRAINVVWDGKLRGRFCKMFSESSTGRPVQLPCCP